MKRLRWIGTSRKDLISFPSQAQDDLGYQLYRVQIGLEPSDWKPMSAIGTGVCEVRAHYRGEFRVIDIARFEEAIYVLHAVQKKTQKTSKSDLEIARRRLASLAR